MQTCIDYDDNCPVYVVSRRFDAYRRLFRALYEGMFVESRPQTALEQLLLEAEAAFPRTFKRSTFGIKLSEEDIDARQYRPFS